MSDIFKRPLSMTRSVPEEEQHNSSLRITRSHESSDEPALRGDLSLGHC